MTFGSNNNYYRTTTTKIHSKKKIVDNNHKHNKAQTVTGSCDLHCIERVRKHSKGLHASGLTPISDTGNNTCAVYGEKKRLSEEFATVYFNLQIVYDSSATF